MESYVINVIIGLVEKIMLEYNKMYWEKVRKFHIPTEEEKERKREYNRQYREDNPEIVKFWKAEI